MWIHTSQGGGIGVSEWSKACWNGGSSLLPIECRLSDEVLGVCSGSTCEPPNVPFGPVAIRCSTSCFVLGHPPDLCSPIGDSATLVTLVEADGLALPLPSPSVRNSPFMGIKPWN